MFEIDGFVLKQCQSFSDWSQKWFGLDNFFLARIFLGFYVLGFLLVAEGGILLVGFKPGLLISLLIAFLVFYLILRSLRESEAQCRNNPEFKNPLVARFQFLRLMLVAVTAIFMIGPINGCLHFLLDQSEDIKKTYEFFIDLGSSMENLMFFLTVFFSCCTPKPRKPSKAKELVGDLLNYLAPEPQLQIEAQR